jgi:PAS domain S-box-containing protein
MMPELDGFGLLRELDADPQLRAIPVVMLSARAGEEARIEGLQAGADDYLVKPFSARELRARIDAQIRLARVRSAVEAERRRFYSFLDQAPVAIVVFEGPNLTVAYVNELAREQLGEREVVGKPLREALPELRDSPIPEHLGRVFRTGDPHTVVEEPVAVAGPDGALAQRYLTTLRRPLRDESGAIYGVISVGHDVTEAVLAKKALETKSIEAQAASRAKDEFLAMLGTSCATRWRRSPRRCSSCSCARATSCSRSERSSSGRSSIWCAWSTICSRCRASRAGRSRSSGCASTSATCWRARSR